MNADLQKAFSAFAGWIRHIDEQLEKSDKLHHEAEQALHRGDVKTFADNIGTAHGELKNARRDIANVLARGMNLPSDN